MIFHFLLASLLFFPTAQAGNSWISVEPDHFNLVYSEGESAKFLIRILNEPVNPYPQVKAFVQYPGVVAPVEVTLEKGVAVYATSPLFPGEQEFHFLTHLVSVPHAEPSSVVVEDQVFRLDVVPGASVNLGEEK